MQFTPCLIASAFCLFAPLAARASEPPQTTEALAAVLRPELPKGWSLQVRDERVVIERGKPVEYYNGIGLPGFQDDAERRRSIKPHVHRDPFVISLHFGEHMTKAAVIAGREKNRLAHVQARKDSGQVRLMPDAEFWEKHPKYGYRELPKFEAGQRSIYMDVTPYGAPWAFWSESVAAECEGVLTLIKKRLREY